MKICQDSADIPFNLKVSYTQQLQMKLFIRQTLIDKNFNRYWFVVNSFQSEQTAFLMKKFLQYLELGDLYRIQTDLMSFGWKQKMQTDKQICYDTLETLGVGSHKRKSKDIVSIVSNIYKENQHKQFHGMKFVIIANNDPNPQVHNSILEELGKQNDPDIYVSLFVHPTFYYELNEKHQKIKKWVEIRNLQGIERQTKNMFYNFKKFGLKRMNIRMECLDGAIFMKDNHQESDWFQCNHEIVNEIIFPKYNKMYIHLIQFRNLGYLENYNFRISFLTQDCKSKKYSSVKVFKLKPTRDQFSNIIGYDYVKENQEMIKVLINVQQSLTYETFSQHQKLDSLKVIGKKALVQIKTLVENGNGDQKDRREQQI